MTEGNTLASPRSHIRSVSTWPDGIREQFSTAEENAPGHRSPRKSKMGAILIIDPRSLTRESIAHWLKARGLRIQTIANAEEIGGDLGGGIDLVALNIGGATVADAEISETIDLLHRMLPGIPITIVADRDDCSSITEALSRGVQGYIPTNLSLSVMIEALRLVRAGGTFVPATAFLGSLQGHAAPPEEPPARMPEADPCPNGFTPRQLEVLALLRQGKPNKIIAFELAMQQSTVKVHVRHIMAKLKATNRTQAAVLAGLLFEEKSAANA